MEIKWSYNWLFYNVNVGNGKYFVTNFAIVQNY